MERGSNCMKTFKENEHPRVRIHDLSNMYSHKWVFANPIDKPEEDIGYCILYIVDMNNSEARWVYKNIKPKEPECVLIYTTPEDIYGKPVI